MVGGTSSASSGLWSVSTCADVDPLNHRDGEGAGTHRSGNRAPRCRRCVDWLNGDSDSVLSSITCASPDTQFLHVVNEVDGFQEGG